MKIMRHPVLRRVLQNVLREPITMHIADGLVTFEEKGRAVAIPDNTRIQLIEGPQIATPRQYTAVAIFHHLDNPSTTLTNFVVYREGRLFSAKGEPFHLSGLASTHRVRIVRT